MKKIFLLPLLIMGLYSCSNDDKSEGAESETNNALTTLNTNLPSHGQMHNDILDVYYTHYNNDIVSDMEVSVDMYFENYNSDVKYSDVKELDAELYEYHNQVIAAKGDMELVKNIFADIYN